MSNYTKLFGSILDSTVWQAPLPAKVVWITMLAMSDRDGVVEASVPGLALRAGVERGDCERALALFSAPDPDSRTTAHEGRRILKIDGGWQLLNYESYRDRATKEEAAEKNAARVRRFRERKAARMAGNGSGNGNVTTVTPVTSGALGNALTSPQAHLTSGSPQAERERAREEPGPLTWIRASVLWCEAMGIIGTGFSPGAHESELKSLVRMAGGDEAKLAATLANCAADPWVRDNRPMPSYLVKAWATHQKPPKRRGGIAPPSPASEFDVEGSRRRVAALLGGAK